MRILGSYPVTRILSALALGSLAVGCVVKEELFIQQVSLESPLVAPPIHVREGGKETGLRVSPHVSVGGRNTCTGYVDGHTLVNDAGVFQVDTTRDARGIHHFRETPGTNRFFFKGENLELKVPPSTFGLDVDARLSRVFALTAGGQYATAQGTDLVGFGFGFGLIAGGKAHTVRFDGGARWQEVRYEAQTVVVQTSSFFGSSVEEVFFYRDRKKELFRAIYGSITLSSVSPERGFDFFFQFGVTGQTFLDFQPRQPTREFFATTILVEDHRADVHATILSFTPGMVFRITGDVILVTGIRIQTVQGLERSSLGAIVSPVVQFDFSL